MYLSEILYAIVFFTIVIYQNQIMKVRAITYFHFSQNRILHLKLLSLRLQQILGQIGTM